MRRPTRKTKKPPARPTPRTRRKTHTPQMSLAAARRLGLLLLWCGSLAAVAYGLHRLEPLALQAQGDGSWELRWVDVPTSIDELVLDEIRTAAERHGPRPLFDADLRTPTLCANLKAALEASPWIAEVWRVSKQADGVVQVEARFREWLTYVVRNDMGHLVDGEGVRLPRQAGAAYLPPVDSNVILVEGVTSRVPAVGAAWDDPAVHAGLELVKYLHASLPPGLRDSIRAVDVANYENRLNARDGWLRLRTIHPGQYISWGLPPGQEYDIESSAQRKVEALWALYRQHGQLPNFEGLDVRDKHSVLHRVSP